MQDGNQGHSQGGKRNDRLAPPAAHTVRQNDENHDSPGRYERGEGNP